jgi:tRNA pseudouridine55 synthase
MISRVAGLLVVDKPSGMTSRTAVDRALRWFPRDTRVGHTGTLDPLATGVLVLCLGNATRLAEYIQQMRKSYRTRLLLGMRSDTDDADGNLVPVPGATAPDLDAVSSCISGFLGAIEQVPPAYSAAKISGRRAYDLARRGKDVALQPRTVTIYAIEILDYHYPHLDLQVHCGKGTYIRSLARDVGERLGCGALVETLRRTRLGPFTVEDALPLDADAAAAHAHLLPLERAVVDLPRVVLGEGDLQRLRQGQSIRLTDVPANLENERELAVFDDTDQLMAIGRIDVPNKTLYPSKVLRS